MNTVHLHGRLKEAFGGSFDLEIDTPKEAIRALSQLPGFDEMIAEGNWRVVRGGQATGQALDIEGLDLGLGDQPLHIIPVAEGAGDGLGQVIIGAALIAVAWWNPASWAAGIQLAVGSVGVGMMTSGAALMMTPIPETGSYEEKKKNEQSYLFDGPVNVNKQGVAVPLLYGEVITGSVVISAGIRANDIPVESDGDGNIIEDSAELLEGK